MMRYQRVASPDFHGQISSFPSSSSSSDVKPLRVGSGSTNPIQTETHSLPTKNPKSQSNNNKNNNGKLLLQWGQKKRSRNFIKVQRRAAIAGEVKIAAVTASGSLPPCVNLRTHQHKRNAEERSNGQSRPENRSPPSIGVVPDGSSPADPDPKPPVEEEKVRLAWPRIYVTLSRKEKEDDFMAMKGSKLPQRPKKRGKNIEKALQYCYPGMWLSDLTRGRYEVREKRCAKKKRRGLKGMESMDSDSE